jgi:hypothetical protein
MVKTELVSQKIIGGGSRQTTYIFRPEQKTELFTYDDVKKIFEGFKNKVPNMGNPKFCVRALNILRDTTLKGFAEDFKTLDQYDDYVHGKVADMSKFLVFYNVTITVSQDVTPNETSLFRKK